MSLKSIIKKEVAKIAPVLANANDIDVHDDSLLHKESFIRAAKFRGKLTLSKGCRILGGVKIYARTPIKIGRYTSLNGPATELSSAVNTIEIGNFCSIAQKVTLQEYNHNHDRISSYFIFNNIFKEKMEQDIKSKGSIVLGNDVWIGSNASILSGVKIGHGAVVAANSVVTKDVPDYAIVGGIPAKTIKMRFEEKIVDRLLQIEWWDWSIEKIKENRPLFEKSLTLEMLKKF